VVLILNADASRAADRFSSVLERNRRPRQRSGGGGAGGTGPDLHEPPAVVQRTAHAAGGSGGQSGDSSCGTPEGEARFRSRHRRESIRRPRASGEDQDHSAGRGLRRRARCPHCEPDHRPPLRRGTSGRGRRSRRSRRRRILRPDVFRKSRPPAPPRPPLPPRRRSASSFPPPPPVASRRFRDASGFARRATRPSCLRWLRRACPTTVTPCVRVCWRSVHPGIRRSVLDRALTVGQLAAKATIPPRAPSHASQGPSPEIVRRDSKSDRKLRMLVDASER